MKRSIGIWLTVLSFVWMTVYAGEQQPDSLELERQSENIQKPDKNKHPSRYKKVKKEKKAKQPKKAKEKKKKKERKPKKERAPKKEKKIKTPKKKKEKSPKKLKKEKKPKKEKKAKKEHALKAHVVTARDVLENRDAMEEMYHGIEGFGQLPEQERQGIEAGYEKKTSTYGEIPYESLQVILEDPQLHFGPNDVFYDLGSGVGKAVMQVYLNTPVKRAVGIELSDTRFAGAQEVLKRFNHKKLMQKGRTLEYIHGDMLKEPFKDATIIYMCSTCYDPKLMNDLIERFAKLKPGTIIISLKELPLAQMDEKRKNAFQEVKQYMLDMTWSRGKGSPVHVYKVK